MKILLAVFFFFLHAQCLGVALDYQQLKKKIANVKLDYLIKKNDYYVFLDSDYLNQVLTFVDQVLLSVQLDQFVLSCEEKATLSNVICSSVFSIFSYLTNSEKLVVQNFGETKKVFERALRIFATAHVNLLENQKILPVESPKRKRSNSDMGWAAPDVMATVQKVITDLLAGHTFEVKSFFDEIVILVQKNYEGEGDEEDYKIGGSVGLWLDSD
ncbi:hypothetical protein K2X40_00965 [Candidatus Babeliales bacterium]|nr:hypothetical protein [Candidatus Babeliales bacterium]